MSDPRGFVVISGLPASGKSSVARRLAHINSVQVIDKDQLLEALFANHESVDRELRSRLSREADTLMKQEVQHTDDAILVSHWKHRGQATSSGTPTQWLFDLSNVKEVFCLCDPDVAVERFLERIRHEGHCDARADRNSLAAQFQILASLGPIGLPRQFTVDTSSTCDISEVADWLGWH